MSMSMSMSLIDISYWSELVWCWAPGELGRKVGQTEHSPGANLATHYQLQVVAVANPSNPFILKCHAEKATRKLFPPQKWRPTASWQYDWWFVQLWEQPNWWPPRPKIPSLQRATCHLVLEGPFGDVRNLRGARTKNVQRKLKCENAWECLVAGQPAGLASK